MAKKKKHSSHPDQDGLKKYLKGDSSPKEEHAIEKESLADPFLDDALEGLESLNPEEIIKDLDQLERQIDTRSTTKANTFAWLYRSAAAFLVLIIASSIIYFLSIRGDTISNQETITLKQDNTEEEDPGYPGENEIEEAMQESDSEKSPLIVKEEYEDDDDVNLSIAKENQSDIIDNQEEKIKRINKPAVQQTSEEKIESKTLDIATISVQEDEIDSNIEFEDSPTAIQQEFSVTEDLSAEPSKKLTRKRSASPELSGAELSSVRQDIIVPEPAGGMEEYDLYLSESLNYPEDARRDNIEGTVIVQCSISSDSLPTECLIIQSLIKSCDDEAIRLIKEGPKWKLVSDPTSDQQQKIVMEIEFKLKE